MTKVDLELISDADMYLFFEKGLRGGASYTSKRYRKSNNKYLNYLCIFIYVISICDPKQESKHIIYLGANNLYGYDMFKFLARGGFKWIEPKDFDSNK